VEINGVGYHRSLHRKVECQKLMGWREGRVGLAKGTEISRKKKGGCEGFAQKVKHPGD